MSDPTGPTDTPADTDTVIETPLSARVAWSSTPSPVRRRWVRRAGHWATVTLDVAVGLLSQTAGTIGVERPRNPDPMVIAPNCILGQVTFRGALSVAPPHSGCKHVVTLTPSGATVKPALQVREVKLAGSALRGGRPRPGHRGPRKAVDTPWRLEVAGEGINGTFTGDWILLAQLGTLAGWPEPA